MRNSTVTIRFHYYNNHQFDELGIGTLVNFKYWKAYQQDKHNYIFGESLQQQGNKGSRAKFTWQGKTYYLQES